MESVRWSSPLSASRPSILAAKCNICLTIVTRIPVVGRNPPYVITIIIFAVLWIPTALVNNFGGLLVLRFLTGFFGTYTVKAE